MMLIYHPQVFSHLVTEAPGVSQLTATIKQLLRQSPAPHEGWPMLATLPGSVDYFPSGGNVCFVIMITVAMDTLDSS